MNRRNFLKTSIVSIATTSLFNFDSKIKAQEPDILEKNDNEQEDIVKFVEEYSTEDNKKIQGIVTYNIKTDSLINIQYYDMDNNPYVYNGPIYKTTGV